MTVVHWRHLSISLLLAALFSACDNPDPLAPSFAATRGAPAAPTNLTATALSYQDISLVWQDNSTNESGWEVYRSLTGPTGTFTLFTVYSGQNITQGGNSGLQASTQYCYRVRAFSTLGQSGKVRAYSDFSNTACATTPGLPVPAAPSGVRASPDAWGRIQVIWTDNASNESGFRIERSATSSGPWASVGTVGPNVASSYDYQPPAEELPACYRVFASNSFGDSGPSNVACTSRPRGPSNLVATVLEDARVVLTWSDNSAVEDGYEVQRGELTGVGLRVVATLPANSTTFHDVGLADGRYGYNVRATRDGGTTFPSFFVTVLVVTEPPAAPSGTTVTASSSSVAALSWVNNSSSEAGFRVERSSDGGATWVGAGTTGVNETWFNDYGQPSEQPLCYRVFAFNDRGDSPASNSDCITLPAGPTNLIATGVEPLTIDLTWTDNSAVETRYEVWAVDYYCGDYDEWGNCIWYPYYSSVATLGPNATSYRVSGLTSGYAYIYVVVALTDRGQSDLSNEVSGFAP